IYSKDKGLILLDGKRYEPLNPVDAQKAGVSIIFQEPTLVPTLSVQENIFLGRKDLPKHFGIIQFKKEVAQVSKLMGELGIDFSLSMRVDVLSYEDQKIVELVRALSLNPKLLIIDETTAAVGMDKRTSLFNQLNHLKEKGIAIVYITHNLQEIFEVGDCVSVLKDGKLVTTKNINETTKEEISTLMIGRKLKGEYFRENYKEQLSNEIVLSAENLSLKGHYRNVCFQLHKGEILGLGGLVGAGSLSISKTIFGILTPDSGKIHYFGKEIRARSCTDIIPMGIAYVPKERDKEGLILSFQVKENITLPILNRLSKWGLVSLVKKRRVAQECIDKLRVIPRDIYRICVHLSGGNRQKVVLAKCLVSQAKIIILNTPTRGMDVGAKAEIYSFMKELKKNGVSIFLISEELPELLGMSDTILIMRKGEITGVFHRSEKPSEEKLLEYML
ncbi:MAG: sugar ABC transporter ATP-binding protein, partial [Candidatus Heimdallarchaeaceae archaeon]